MVSKIYSLCSLVCLFIICLVPDILHAQTRYNSPITVQYADGATSYFETLDEAFAALQSNCVVYIPAGSYQVNNKEIKCPVAIYGAGCRPYGKDTDYTQISGHLKFAEGSSSSTLMGIHSVSNIYILSNVKNILIKNVDVWNIRFSNSSNTGCLVTSSVIRGQIHGYLAPVQVTNCLAQDINNIQGGEIANCILIPTLSHYYYDVFTSLLRNNIGLYPAKSSSINNNQEVCNMAGKDGAQIAYPEGGLDALFEKYDSRDPFNLSKNNYRLKAGVAGTNAGTDGKDIGLYGGAGFDDTGRAPIPKVKIKEIVPRTDKEGKLKVKIEVLKD